MIKLKSIIYLLIFAFFSINKAHANTPVQCFDFIEQYKNLEFARLGTQRPIDTFEDFGFSFNFDPSEKAELLSTDFTSQVRRINNYPVISSISTYKSNGLFKEGDIIISIDGSDTSKMSNEDVQNKFYFPNLDQEYELTLLRGSKEIKINTKPQEYKLAYYQVDFVLEDIKEIDVINSSVTILANFSSILYYYESAYPQIVDLAKKTIIGLRDDGTYGGAPCLGLDADYTKKNRIPNPLETIAFYNLIEENKNLVEDTVDINPYQDDEFYVGFTGNSAGSWELKNEFNLSSFPFDKQRIQISIFGEPIDEVYIEFADISYRLIDYSKNKLSIPGWDVADIKLSSSNFAFKEVIFSELNYDIYIERQYFYYIFKIILPITLILIICWSSVWLDRKEVESKLTITIVCLLSLIAYNFVIDNEIPKLNYLTIMDWIILLSYFYAAAPNILAIITFQLGSKPKYSAFNLKIIDYSKKYGILSYVIFVLFIVVISVSNVPENTIDALSWAMVR